MDDEIGDPLAYYDIEKYLFTTVNQRFHVQGCIDAFDFFSIVRWKANRAISLIAGKFADLRSDPAAMTKQIHDAASAVERLRILIEDWKFRLPMASAILTVFYPDEFSVYDARVSSELGDFQNLADRRRFHRLWLGYENYMRAVNEHTPSGLNLRDKDRFLWGRSAARGLQRNLRLGFKNTQAAQLAPSR